MLESQLPTDRQRGTARIEINCLTGPDQRGRLARNGLLCLNRCLHLLLEYRFAMQGERMQHAAMRPDNKSFASKLR